MLQTTHGVQSAKKIAKIAERIISMSPAIGPTTRLFTRQMYRFISSQPEWDLPALLPSECSNEIEFWKKNIVTSNGFKIKIEDTATKILYTDASGTGYGGHLIQPEGNLVARGTFTKWERHTSSTYRELLGVEGSIAALEDHLNGESITLYTDNSNVARIISNGSPKPDLQRLAVKIHDISVSRNISIRTQWIPRELNTVADTISKIKDSDNWSIDDETFQYIQSRFGAFTVDRFADNINNKVPHFNSKFYCPNTSLVDAFAADWSKDFNWLCPPIKLVGKTIRHAKKCRSRGVLFVPRWESAYFWPMITRDGKDFDLFVRDFLHLDPYYFNNASVTDSVFEGFADFKAFALLIDFTDCPHD